MKLSVASSIFVNYSIQDAIRLAAEAGYDGVDIWGGRPHVYRKDFSPLELRALRKQVEECGLQVPSFMPAFFRYPHSLSSPNEIVRQDSLDYMRNCLDNALELGAQVLLVIPGRSLHGQDVQEARRWLLDSLHTICSYTESADIKLGLEPANMAVTDLVNTSQDAKQIISELGYANLGVVLDSGHVNLGTETPKEAIQLLGSRLFQVHINDNDGRRQQNLIPGLGTIYFEEWIRLLNKEGYTGYLSIELAWDYALDPLPAVKEAFDWVKELI
jgi:fructoselysine 3-epimerase